MFIFSPNVLEWSAEFVGGQEAVIWYMQLHSYYLPCADTGAVKVDSLDCLGIAQGAFLMLC